MRILRPSSKFTFTFADDSDLPQEDRPTLHGKVLSVGDVREIKASGIDTGDIDSALDAMFCSVYDWKNVSDPDTGDAVPFSRESVMKYMTLDEVAEVVSFLFGKASPGDQKKSESPHT